MSHHSSDHPLTALPPELLKNLRLMNESADGAVRRCTSALQQRAEGAKLEQIEKELGPTGDFPAGRITAHDEGGLMFGVTTFNGRVILDFGKPIRSIGFTRNDALELARILRQRAKSLPPIIGAQRETESAD